jgi:type IV secretion system protein VirB6
MYGIGTIFSMALLSVVASMVLDLTVKISEALWGAKIVNSILGNSTEGLTSTAMQQGGIGLLLSILVVSVPPMAAMFFQGTLGSALTYSVFTPTGGRPGPQGQPAGSWAMQNSAFDRGSQQSGRVATDAFQPNLNTHRTPGQLPSAQNDTIKGPLA